MGKTQEQDKATAAEARSINASIIRMAMAFGNPGNGGAADVFARAIADIEAMGGMGSSDYIVFAYGVRAEVIS